MIRAAIITISDKGYAGEREDESGGVIERMIKPIDAKVVARDIVPDEIDMIVHALEGAVKEADLIITTGGTGISPRDVTPEAVGRIIKKELPGFGEAMRAAGLRSTPHAILSRSLAGVTEDGSLIIALPGSPKAVEESLGGVIEAVAHCIEVSKGKASECAEHGQKK